MKILKILNKINFLAIGSYIPYLILFYDDFFGKNNEDGIMALFVFIFLVIFFCGGPVLIVAESKNVENSVQLSELKKYGKAPVISAFAVYAVGIIIFILFVHSKALWFYIASSTVCLGSAFVCKAAIDKIASSPFYKCAIPWIYYPIIVLLCFFGFIFIAEHAPSFNNFKYLSIIWFVIFGLMVIGLVRARQYIVNEEDCTVEIDNPRYIFKDNPVLSLKNVKYVTEKKMYFLINYGESEYKIYKFYSNINRFRDTLVQNRIDIVNSNLKK